MESKINRGVAATANLFVKAEVFESIGLFPDNVKSGGDVQWTARATEKGFLLVYDAQTIVYHPARLFGELLVKLYRVGIGMGQILIAKNSSKSQIFQAVIGKLKPYSVSFIKQLIARKGCEKMNKKLIRIWLTANLFRPVMAMAIAQALFSRDQKMTRTDQ